MLVELKAQWVCGLLCLLTVGLAVPAAYAGQPVQVVAAESSYGSVVRAIGGDHVHVVSLLDSPGVDPHDFKATPGIARQLQNADLVVMNGLGYDSWMVPLLKGTPNGTRQVVVAGKEGRAMVKPDKNPHVFYDPRIMLVVASRIAQKLSRIDPGHRADYKQGLTRFRKKLLPIYAQIQKLISAYPTLTVTSTEPVYGYMLRLLGYRDLYKAFQFSTMKGSAPSARQVKQFVQGLKAHKVDLLICNREVHSKLTKFLVETAKEAGLPVVAVSEIPLHGEGYVQWQLNQLTAVAKALRSSRQDTP